MTKADLFKTRVVCDETITNFYIELTFSDVARYSPKVHIEGRVPIPDYMKIIEAIADFVDNKNWDTSKIKGDISLEKLSNGFKLIYKDHYFTVKTKKDMLNFVDSELGMLLRHGMLA